MKTKEYYLRERERIREKLIEKYGGYNLGNFKEFNAEYKKEIRKLYRREQK